MKIFCKKNVSFICGAVVVGVFFLMSCTRDIGVKEQAQAQLVLNESWKLYKSQEWTERHSAVEKMGLFLSQIDKSIIQTLISGKKKDSESIEYFYLTAVRDSHSMVRIDALKGLSLLLSEEAYPVIANMAVNDRSDNVRWYAVQTLSLYRKNAASDIFTRCLNDDDWLIREAAIRGVLMLDEIFQQKKMVSFIIQAIKDPNNNVKAAALSGVTIKDNAIYAEMIELLRTKDKLNSKLLAALLKGLQGYILSEDVRMHVIDLLSYKNREVRINALRVLKTEKVMLKKRNKSK